MYGMLQRLGIQHHQACLDLDRRSLGGLWTSTQWSRELEDPQRPGLGIWRGEHLLAMACGWVILDELHITLIAVDPEQRRRGLGRQILQGLLKQSRGMGAAQATLEVSAANSAALGLYQSMGFETVGIRRGYYCNGEDGLIKWLTI